MQNWFIIKSQQFSGERIAFTTIKLIEEKYIYLYDHQQVKFLRYDTKAWSIKERTDKSDFTEIKNSLFKKTLLRQWWDMTQTKENICKSYIY